MAKMKENFIAYILIPMWVFNLMCKLVQIHFKVLRGRKEGVKVGKIIFLKVSRHSSIPPLSDAV